MAKGKKTTAKGSAGLNRNATRAVLEKYQSRADVHTTASGLMYRVIQPADALTPLADSVVKLHQRIQLADGTVIDDTYKSGMPETFALNEAIEGLQEALLLMPVGARYEIIIPPELAWGKRGNGGKIGANAVMIMDVRLLAVE